MRVCDITGYLIELERSGFTGAVTLNFHKGNMAKRIEIKNSVFVLGEKEMPMMGNEEQFVQLK